MSTLFEQYNAAKSEVSRIVGEITLMLKDKSKPLDGRWDLLCKFEDDLPEDGCCHDVDLIDSDGKRIEITYYDDLYTDRGVTITFSTIIEHLEGHATKFPMDMIDDLKERLLQSGYGSTCNDW